MNLFLRTAFSANDQTRLPALSKRPVALSALRSRLSYLLPEVDSAIETPSSEKPLKSASSDFLHRHSVAVVLLLTLVGGAFRFLTLARPVVWFDEAQTFRRVSGSFSAMMQKLRNDGFVPLHYWIEWGLGRLLGGPTHLTPFWLRFMPALAGTLMVPAMYGLARQFCSKRTALLVAAFTTCSAYMNIFSHDAKMYMPLWLFCALSTTCLLIWSRKGGRAAWVGWVAASGLMVAFHASGLALLAVQPIIFLFSRNVHDRRRTVSLVIGLAVIVAAPLCYYTCFNRWVHEVRHGRWDETSGLAWLANYQAGRTRSEMLVYAASSYLSGWEWPASVRKSADPVPPGDIAAMCPPAAKGLYIPTSILITFVIANVLLIELAALGAFSGVRTRISLGAGKLSSDTWWRNAIILSVWVVVPMYAFFHISTHPAALLPSAGVRVISFVIALTALLAAIAGAVYCWRRLRRDALSEKRFSFQLALVFLVPATLCIAIYAAGQLIHPLIPRWGGIWGARYMGIVWPAGAIAVCAMLLSLRVPWVRYSAIGLLLAVNCAQSIGLVTASTDAPADRIVHDIWAARDPAGTLRAYVPENPPDPELLGGSAFVGPGKYYYCLESGVALGPDHWFDKTFEECVPVHSPKGEAAIVTDVQQSSRLRTVIVWDCFVGKPGADADQLSTRLGSTWKKTSESLFPVRYCWNWANIYVCRRRTYTKIASEAPSTVAHIDLNPVLR
jgi:4-amino-4-deoxy-L-arabinose transferase-like glycosyltransferase